MAECRAAFYARVSSEAQARDNTIASQVAALREELCGDVGDDGVRRAAYRGG